MTFSLDCAIRIYSDRRYLFKRRCGWHLHLLFRRAGVGREQAVRRAERMLAFANDRLLDQRQLFFADLALGFAHHRFISYLPKKVRRPSTTPPMVYWKKYRHPNHFRPFFDSFDDEEDLLADWEYCSNNLDLKPPSKVASSAPSMIRRFTSIISKTFRNSLMPASKRVK